VLVLIRPVAIVYFVAVAFASRLRRVRMRTIAVYVALALVLPVGWQLRNLHTPAFSPSRPIAESTF